MKILCLDGGGVFGFAQARILDEAKCSDKFDAFVGTSIGSAVAAAHALGVGEKVNQDFFDEWMPQIFKKPSVLRRMNPFASKYPDEKLIEALQYVFRSSNMGDVKRPLFVTAVNVSAKRLKVFDSFNVDDSSLPLWKVIRSATAAETYFRPFSGVADGGILANNPSLVAIASAVVEFKAKVEDIEILSIGTGDGARGNGTPRTKIGWGLWLIGALLDGASDGMNDYYVRALAKGGAIKRYERIQFPSELHWEMDSVESMRDAERAWEPDIRKAIQTVRDF